MILQIAWYLFLPKTRIIQDIKQQLKNDNNKTKIKEEKKTRKYAKGNPDM